MKFAVILQGVVDNTNLLEIPKGTDLFDWNNISRYFSLIYQNIIWIRDGENVYHVDTDFDFQNAIFPNKDQFDGLLRWVQEYVWISHFASEKARYENTENEWDKKDFRWNDKQGALSSP